MAKTIFNHNIDLYNTDEENEYVKRRSHILRFLEVEHFVGKEIYERKSKNTKMLSIGCALGHFEKKLIAKYNIEMFGIDGAEESVKHAKENGVKAVQGDFEERLPYEDASFDIVYAGEVIEHIMDVSSFLKEVNRILKHDGLFILTTPNLARLDDRFKFLFGKSPRHTAPLHRYLYLHIHPFTWHSLKDALIKCGFSETKLRSNFVELYSTRILQIQWLARFFPSFGVTLIVSARKI